MNVRSSKFALKTLAAGCVLALAAGCASTSQLDEVRAEAEEARRMAEEAKNMVEQARSSIQEAMEMARAASAAAEASQNCCTDLERKLDRALQDMQRK
ncbi:MAG: Lpp/OprI family alanine-zipper lipoprotein [Wenzhouxiangellaceae bacterium]|nr:Lpp/OprI family alanine-zipper lipoprotein [Wenzhouxiangellaceae bacterium]